MIKSRTEMVDDDISNERIIEIYFEALDALQKCKNKFDKMRVLAMMLKMSCNQNSQNEFQIMHWNAQAITSPSAMLELEHVLNEKHIDIVLINETFLKPHHRFKLKNCNIV